MRRRLSLLMLCALVAAPAAASASEVRVKDLGRFHGWRENALVGYGVVMGLAGSGDSPRNEVTRQAMRNALSRMGANVAPEQIQSRNVALVMVTATLPASASLGDRIDVTVSSIGDARSLAGGTLLMTPLMGPNQRTYALAQGSLVVGGHRYDDDRNVRQRNHPTAGQVPGGATVELAVRSELAPGAGELTFILADPDPTTAQRVADGINDALGAMSARVRDAASVSVSTARAGGDINRLVARIENVAVVPDQRARVVINERSGTVVAGGGVQISSVVLSQGDIKVAVTADRYASQPEIYGGYAPEARSLIVTNTKLEVTEPGDAVASFPSTTVADLIQGLNRLRVSTRSMIAILQGMKAAGALHAEIVVQ